MKISFNSTRSSIFGQMVGVSKNGIKVFKDIKPNSDVVTVALKDHYVSKIITQAKDKTVVEDLISKTVKTFYK